MSSRLHQLRRTVIGIQGAFVLLLAGGWLACALLRPELVDKLTSEPSLASYHLLPSVRGDLLMKLGRYEEARVELERAASLTRNARERALLLERAATCARNGASAEQS